MGAVAPQRIYEPGPPPEPRPQRGMGWLPDLPDIRDYTTETTAIPSTAAAKGERDSIKSMLKTIGVDAPVKSLPTSVDLREYFSPIEDQGQLGSCTANAGVGLVEYFERRAFGRHIDASRLFLYKTTRNFLHQHGDTGAYLRSTMGAMTLFGVPPEEFWPYDINNFDAEPPAFCYAFAQNYQAINYYRLDSTGMTPGKLLDRIKTNLGAGLPSMFGFTVYSSISQANSNGKIPWPAPKESVEGGHAVAAVGYDDNLEITNTNSGGKKTTGALRIRNSWGTSWGENGYGWLPYEYVLQEIAIDFWSLLKNGWVNTGVFKT